MTFRDVFLPGGDESSHLHDGGDISGGLPYVRSVGGVNIPALASRVAAGYVFGGTVYFTSSDTFTKADYPGLRAVRVHVQAGGGGGGGAGGTSVDEEAAAGGGGGGEYAESFLLVEDLSESVAISVGAGGSGGAAGFNPGSTGGNSSFGSYVIANGGGFGQGGNSSSSWGSSFGGLGGSGGTGDRLVPGSSGGNGLRTPNGGLGGLSGEGGDSFLGAGGRQRRGASEENAEAGVGYGSGGSGAVNNASSAAKAGGDGAPGIVIVELWF